MKRLFYSILLACSVLCYASCEDYETYADKKEKERDAIDRYIASENIKVISEAAFNAQGQTTDVASNEFVLFDRNGVYMQIVRKGCGEKLEEKKAVTLLCRFLEYNILADTTLLCNSKPFPVYSSVIQDFVDASQYVEKMSVVRTGTTITASFVSGLMTTYHGSTSVPSGWLVPLNYVNVGRPVDDGDEISKVRLIVPHSQGTGDATTGVYPCYYEITYEREN